MMKGKGGAALAVASRVVRAAAHRLRDDGPPFLPPRLTVPYNCTAWSVFFWAHHYWLHSSKAKKKKGGQVGRWSRFPKNAPATSPAPSPPRAPHRRIIPQTMHTQYTGARQGARGIAAQLSPPLNFQQTCRRRSGAGCGTRPRRCVWRGFFDRASSVSEKGCLFGFFSLFSLDAHECM